LEACPSSSGLYIKAKKEGSKPEESDLFMIRGYDTPRLYREDTLLRIKRLEREVNDCAKQMNDIILKGNLPEELVELPYPDAEDDDPQCE